MVIKQLEDGRYTLWCPACNDLHVTDESHEILGDPAAPTIRHALYDWDDKNVCHLQVHSGNLYFLPDCTHDYAERTVPMLELPNWMSDELDALPEAGLPEVEPVEPDDSDLYFDYELDDDTSPVGTWDPKLGWVDS